MELRHIIRKAYYGAQGLPSQILAEILSCFLRDELVRVHDLDMQNSVEAIASALADGNLREAEIAIKSFCTEYDCIDQPCGKFDELGFWVGYTMAYVEDHIKVPSCRKH